MLQPAWKIQATSKGETLIVGGYTYHLGDDPVRRGRMEAMETAVVVDRQGGKKALLIGFGLGYLAQPLAAMLDIPLAIWDSMPIAKQERRDRYRMTMGRAKFLYSDQEVLDWLDDETSVLCHNSAVDLHYWEIQFCETQFSRMDNKNIKAVSQRSLDFLARLPTLGLVQEHYGLGAGRTCLIVSPGPTLDVDMVKGYYLSGYPILCAAQALAKLNAAGVQPTATVCLDPQGVIYDYLQAGASPGAIYADAMVDPRIWDAHPDRCFAFSVPTAHCHAQVWRSMGYDWLDEPCITVSEVMLEIAIQMGFSSVLTSGVDYWVPMRTETCRIECLDGRWTGAHYYAGWHAWQRLVRKHAVDWARLDDDPNYYPALTSLELPPPSTKIPLSLVNANLQRMIPAQPEAVQKQIMSALPPSIRESFSPLTGSAPVMVSS